MKNCGCETTNQCADCGHSLAAHDGEVGEPCIVCDGCPGYMTPANYPPPLGRNPSFLDPA